jgi:hypothetical protein
MNAIVSSAMIWYVIGPSGSGIRPCPRRSGLYTRYRSANVGVNPANVFTDAKPPGRRVLGQLERTTQVSPVTDLKLDRDLLVNNHAAQSPPARHPTTSARQ